MAIAFDKAGGNNDPGNSVSVSLAAAVANSVAIISVQWNAVYSFSGLSVNGSSAGVTQAISEFSTDNGGGKCRVYYLYNPPTSSVAYAFSSTPAGDGVSILVSIYSGANSVQPDATITHGNNGVTSITADVTVVAANCWLVGWARSTGSLAASTGTTSRANNGSVEQIGDSNGTVGTGAQSMSWSRTGSGTMTTWGLSLAIASAAPATSSLSTGSMTLLGVGN